MLCPSPLGCQTACSFPALSMSYHASMAVRPCSPGKGLTSHCNSPSPVSQAPSSSGAETTHSPARSSLAEEQSGQCPDAGDLAVVRTKGTRVAQLRRTIAKLETSSGRVAPGSLPLGVPEIDRHLPRHGLTCGVLHEVIAATREDTPAALGFLLASTSLALKAKPGVAVLVASQRAFDPWGGLYGHGLDRLGVDPSRLMLVAARTDKEALWAIEEILKSRVRPAMVSGALASCPDLTASRRLNLAAAALAIPLSLACAEKGSGASAAATRWRIATLPASRDRFGALLNSSWSVSLERCRHGRPGKWFVEWNHVAHRFSLVEGMADRSSPQGTGRLRIAG
jgi:protein ImuA